MIFRFALILFVAALFGLLGYWFYLNPGFMMMSWLGIEFRIPIFVVVVTLVLLILICVMAYKIIAWVFRLPFRLTAKLTQKRKEKGEKELILLASAVASENSSEALKRVKKAKPIRGDEPLYWMYTAQAYGLASQHLEESKAYGKLMETAPLLALKGQALAALKREDRQSALEYLEKAREIDSRSSWILRNLLTLYKDAKRYTDAEQVINKLEDFGYLTPRQAKKQLAALYQTMSNNGHLSGQAKEEALRKAHFLDPSLEELTEVYARLMFKQGHETNALKALKATWKENPKQQTADTFIELQQPETPMKAYEIAKKLVKDTSGQLESQILLARYGLKAKLWGETRKLLELLERTSPAPQIYKLLAELEIQEHNNVKAAYAWAAKGLEQ